ncbi:DNA mismatch repair protein [Vibrio vulnificus]|uniref:DNA mismatch repair protein n=1 Tax=Vibrio vulnificus TaxID=672 RepID=UPI00215C726A|nr:DNA mismatch repair protein [Vibrio vulnificus]MCR9501866.1 DNA mismatch repair protein [Vibrio vulnificus]
MFEETKDLSVIDEKDRANKFISSLLFSRATVFHPSARMTPSMSKRMAEVASMGGVSFDHPLEVVTVNSFGKNFRVELHNNYLLHAHRDVLETLLAYAKLIKLDDEAYKSGGKMTWRAVLGTLNDAQTLPNSSEQSLDEEIDNNAIVLSMSMYELATRMKIKPTRSNYRLIEDRIFQLNTSKLFICEMDSDGHISSRKPLSFVKEFMLCYDKSKNKNGKSDDVVANHIFVVPDQRLLEAIKSHGYYYRLEQHKITNYRSYAVRSFIKWLTTHNLDFLHTKKLSWAIEEYMNSVASNVGASFRYDLKRSLLEVRDQIESDFNLQIVSVDGREHQFFKVT